MTAAWPAVRHGAAGELPVTSAEVRPVGGVASGRVGAESEVAGPESGVAGAEAGVAGAEAGVAGAEAGVAGAEAGVAGAEAGVAGADAGADAARGSERSRRDHDDSQVVAASLSDPDRFGVLFDRHFRRDSRLRGAAAGQRRGR